jgi:hypothetical protein
LNLNEYLEEKLAFEKDFTDEFLSDARRLAITENNEKAIEVLLRHRVAYGDIDPNNILGESIASYEHPIKCYTLTLKDHPSRVLRLCSTEDSEVLLYIKHDLVGALERAISLCPELQDCVFSEDFFSSPNICSLFDIALVCKSVRCIRLLYERGFANLEFSFIRTIRMKEEIVKNTCSRASYLTDKIFVKCTDDNQAYFDSVKCIVNEIPRDALYLQDFLADFVSIDEVEMSHHSEGESFTLLQHPSPKAYVSDDSENVIFMLRNDLVEDLSHILKKHAEELKICLFECECISEDDISITITDSFWRTTKHFYVCSFLQEACKRGAIKCFELLLSSGFDIHLNYRIATKSNQSNEIMYCLGVIECPMTPDGKNIARQLASRGLSIPNRFDQYKYEPDRVLLKLAYFELLTPNLLRELLSSLKSSESKLRGEVLEQLCRKISALENDTALGIVQDLNLYCQESLDLYDSNAENVEEVSETEPITFTSLLSKCSKDFAPFITLLASNLEPLQDLVSRCWKVEPDRSSHVYNEFPFIYPFSDCATNVPLSDTTFVVVQKLLIEGAVPSFATCEDYLCMLAFFNCFPKLDEVLDAFIEFNRIQDQRYIRKLIPAKHIVIHNLREVALIFLKHS